MLVAIIQSPMGLNMTRRPEPLSASVGSIFSFSCTSWNLFPQSSTEVRCLRSDSQAFELHCMLPSLDTCFSGNIGTCLLKTNHFPVRNFSGLVQWLLDGPTKASSKYPNALRNKVLHKLTDHSFITMFSLYQDPLNAKITFPSGILSETL